MGTILIDKLLSAAVKQGASDLHITVGQPPVLRLHGRMQRLKTKVLEPADTAALMKSITPDRCQQEFQETGSADFGFAFGDAARFRVSIFKQRGNTAMVLRQIPIKMWTMDELSVPQIFKQLITRPRGLVIVTGPTGSGKTTSLAAMVDYLNDNFDHHIITIEDPIEFQHTHKKCTIPQPVAELAVPFEVPVLTEVRAPGDGDFPRCGVLPDASARGRELLIRLCCKPRLYAWEGRWVLAAEPIQPLVHRSGMGTADPVGKVNPLTLSRPPVGQNPFADVQSSSSSPTAAPSRLTRPVTCSAGAYRNVPAI